MPSDGAWTPIIRLDLTTASKQAFEDAWETFIKERDKRLAGGLVPAMPFDKDGWTEITPQQAEAALILSAGNRALSFPVIRNYASDLRNADWCQTGEAICFSAGKLRNGHHRLVASYLSGQTLPSFVIVSVPEHKDIFAYYDAGKRRTNADALYIAGWNGAGRVMAQAISELALRYDAHALGALKQKRFRTVNPREELAYLAEHPDFQHAARRILGGYPDAVNVIGSKPAAVMFAWLVLRTHGDAALENFCTPLGSGAMLDEDSPILAARNKLLAPEKMYARTRLAYVNKAFLIHIAGQKMGRSRGKVLALTMDLDEPFPRIEAPIAEAAE
jgi:hypothetical protein